MSEQLYWDRLQKETEALLAGFDGVAGIALVDLTSGQRIGANSDAYFPTASTIKIHLLAALLQLHHDGELNLSERRVLPKSTPGSGVLSYLDDEVALTWRDVANLMIIVSDNTATNLVIDLIGFERMNSLINNWGLTETKVQRKMQDQVAVAAGRENVATPGDIVKFLELIWQGDVFAPGVAAECLRVLKKPKKSLFAASLPAGVEIANKPGAMDRVRCDAGIVLLANRPYAMAIMTKYGHSESFYQAQWVSESARALHDKMAILDASSVHGQGVPASARGSGGK